jgi:dynein heavy chain
MKNRFQNLPFKCNLQRYTEVREWNIWGLPTDNVSIDNGILVTRGKRWGAARWNQVDP